MFSEIVALLVPRFMGMVISRWNSAGISPYKSKHKVCLPQQTRRALP